MLPITTVISFLGIKAIPEAIKAARDAYASNPGAAADILRSLDQQNIQQAAQAMQELAPHCATNVAKSLNEAARHLRS